MKKLTGKALQNRIRSGRATRAQIARGIRELLTAFKARNQAVAK